MLLTGQQPPTEPGAVPESLVQSLHMTAIFEECMFIGLSHFIEYLFEFHTMSIAFGVLGKLNSRVPWLMAPEIGSSYFIQPIYFLAPSPFTSLWYIFPSSFFSFRLLAWGRTTIGHHDTSSLYRDLIPLHQEGEIRESIWDPPS